MSTRSPFHEGEQRVQSMMGVRESIEPWARQVVRPFLPEEHRAFHTALPFLVAAARDQAGRPWVTLLTGPEGFVDSPDPEHLRFAVRPLPGDALEKALGAGSELGLLGIDLATRRRNRVNGRIVEDGRDGLLFEVGQSFGNCPQYIHEREWRRVTPATDAPARRHRTLTPDMKAWIRAADTLFIASGHHGDGEHQGYGMDASHRGGEPGFVTVEGDTRLVIPDYAGNNHYNTIGNLVMDPRAGLLFVDFRHGSLLQLTGRTTIDWDSPAVAGHPGARRLVVFELEEAVELTGVLPLRWSAATGSVRTLRLVDRVAESDDVTSFHFESRDGGPLPDFEAGQHLPLEVRVPGRKGMQARTYSLSGAPGGDRYRISVKREPDGLVSRHLHDAVAVGAFIDARAPAGDFVLTHNARPAVLLSAGVGLTPMVSMLGAIDAEGGSREAWFIHGARDGRHHPLAREVRDRVAGNPRLRAHVAYSRPRPEDREGADFDSQGRVDGALVARLLPDLDAEFYLCGPTAFMAAMTADLRALGVADERIHSETFGPAAG